MSQPKTYLDKRFRLTALLPKLIQHCHIMHVNISLGSGFPAKLFDGKEPVTAAKQDIIEQYWRDIGGSINHGYWTVE